LSRDGAAAKEVLAGIARTTADLPGCAEAVRFVERVLGGASAEAQARAAVERLALLTACEALRCSAPAVAELFAATRLAGRPGRTYGSVELAPADARRLMDRALPG